MKNCEYEKWLSSPSVDTKTKARLKIMTDEEIGECFRCELQFGTGGLRGIMDAGTNRMNVYTVRKATQGLAAEIIENGNDAMNSGVVVAYDSRNNSKEFAYECVKVLSANGIKTYLFNYLRPTPLLSFAVRYLNCFRGVVITASHNPKEYNGYKVYGEDGGQITPKTADVILRHIKNIDIFDGVKLTDEPEYELLGSDVDEAYTEAALEQRLFADLSNLSVVYTPLHGSGNLPVRNVLKAAGVKELIIVKEQEAPDGDFPTVNSPNPENPEAFDLAIEYAKRINPDIILGTDPDSDRVGVAVPINGGYTTLNGNQTGALLCEFILRKMKERGETTEDKIIVKTIVTTDLIEKIAADYGVRVENVLTGFKYIGEKIKEFEADTTNKKFFFGLEESYGYLKGTYVRDKDAVVASLLLCEMAADYKNNEKSVYDGLRELYEKYGYSAEILKSYCFEGTEGKKKINKLMDNLRNENPFETEGFKPIAVKDYLNLIDGLPKSNVLKFCFDFGWLAVRPSGTEPKIKFYCSANGKSQDEAEKNLELLKNFVEKSAQ